MVHYYKFYDEFEKKLPKDEKIDRPGNAILLNVFYMQAVGDQLLNRYENRDQRINEWIEKDEAKDDQIANARLSEEPYCRHCSKQGLRIIDKSLIHRDDNAKYDDPEEVMFMLKCPHCKKNSAFWEDGTAWKPKPTLCPKCGTEMTHETSETKTTMTFIYTCPACKHSYKDKMDLRDKKEKLDPDYDKDRIHFCLQDKEWREKLFEIRHGLEQMAELGKEFKEKEDNKHIYDAMKELKKPKIAELSPLLAPSLEKAGYTEFSLDKPEMGRDVYIGFSCLDSRVDREDYDSRKTLKKLVDKALIDTNWRLMSDGINYRLGYLNGRLRAYEQEEDIKKLVMQVKKLKPKQITPDTESELNAHSMDDGKGNRIEY
jgi:hypothetical protein